MYTQPKKRKKGLVIGIGIAVIVIVLAIVAYFLFWHNSEDIQAQKAAESFTTAIVKGKYDQLGKDVTAKSLKQTGFTKQSMEDKYNTVYEGIGIKNAKISHLNVEKSSGSTYQLTYNLDMSTSLGKLKTQKYKTTISKDGDNFKVDWKPALIFPGMVADDKVRMSTDDAKRGDIVDRNGKKLATIGEFREAGIVPEKLGTGAEKGKNIKAISEKLNIPEKNIQATLSQKWVKDDSFVPIKTIIDNKYPQITGVSYAQKQLRTYPFNQATAHLLGYVGEVSAEDIKKNPKLNVGDIIGKSGLERYYDKRLRGENGGEINIVNDKTKQTTNLQKVERKDGETIKLTIDADTQKKAFDSLGNETGSVAMINPQDGELLALVSTPSYDANQMTAGISSVDYEKYNKDTRKPFLARYATRYAPGSTFKTITAAIGLDDGITKPDKSRNISGLKWQKDSSWGKYFVTRVHDKNPVNMVDALVYSDNIYFAQEGLEIGKAKMEAGLKKFDFGEEFNLPFAMPPAQIANDGLKSDILLADTAYGQGQLLMSPIQQAVAYSAIANNGKMVYPILTKDSKQKEAKQVVKAESANIVKQALTKAVSDANGTAHNLAISGHNIAAKTGTAELKKKQGENGLENGFVYAFDADHPNYLMVGMIENVKGRGGSGLVINKLKPVVESMYK